MTLEEIKQYMSENLHIYADTDYHNEHHVIITLCLGKETISTTSIWI